MAYAEDVRLVVNPAAFSEPVAQHLAKIASNDAWSITMEARSGQAGDLISCFGVDPAATNGFDPMYDDPEPPMPPSGDGISLYFPHPEWGALYGVKFNRDIQSPLVVNELRSWSFEVERQGEVDLSWNAVQLDGFSFWLTDLAAGTSMDMTHQINYSYSTTDKIRHFRIDVGYGVSDAAPLPEVWPRNYVVLQNYLNPFNPVTTIQFEIPRKSRVKLTVNDITGREIALLIRKCQREIIPAPGRQAAMPAALIFASSRPVLTWQSER